MLTNIEILECQLAIQQGQLAQLVAQAKMQDAQYKLAIDRNEKQQVEASTAIQKSQRDIDTLKPVKDIDVVPG